MIFRILRNLLFNFAFYPTFRLPQPLGLIVPVTSADVYKLGCTVDCILVFYYYCTWLYCGLPYLGKKKEIVEVQKKDTGSTYLRKKQ